MVLAALVGHVDLSHTWPSHPTTRAHCCGPPTFPETHGLACSSQLRWCCRNCLWSSLVGSCPLPCQTCSHLSPCQGRGLLLRASAHSCTTCPPTVCWMQAMVCRLQTAVMSSHAVLCCRMLFFKRFYLKGKVTKRGIDRDLPSAALLTAWLQWQGMGQATAKSLF